MCCLFGLMDYGCNFNGRQKSRILAVLSKECEVRGTDATGIAYNAKRKLHIYKRPSAAHKLHFWIPNDALAVMGHTRMTTQGSEKKNYNNHPFFGNTGEIDFALAHNGVLRNDWELRKNKHLPKTKIQTDSYIAVQLIEQQKALNLNRLGFLGNFLPVSKAFRWQHKGDDRVILSDEWRLVVHYALHGALSLGSQQDFGLNRGELPQIGDVAIATVHKVIPSFALVEFKHYGASYAGSIHISQFKKLGYGYIKNLWNIAPIGTEYQVSLRAYLEKHECWQLELLSQDNAQG